MRLSNEAFTAGIEEHTMHPDTNQTTGGGVLVRMYSPAKTVVDCFKFRNTIGIDVAIEALREALRSNKATRDDIWKYAGICRMRNALRPYLEALSI